jgi:hypothetical protein
MRGYENDQKIITNDRWGFCAGSNCPQPTKPPIDAVATLGDSYQTGLPGARASTNCYPAGYPESQEDFFLADLSL